FSQDVRLTIVDGIIGEVMAKRAVHERFAKGFSPEEVGWAQENFDNLHPSEQREILQDWALGVEVESDCKHNPITIKCYDLQRELRILGHSTRYVEYPEAPGPENLRARIAALEDATLSGAECIVHTPD